MDNLAAERIVEPFGISLQEEVREWISKQIRLGDE
jgi:hypothetical protein